MIGFNLINIREKKFKDAKLSAENEINRYKK